MGDLSACAAGLRIRQQIPYTGHRKKGRIDMKFIEMTLEQIQQAIKAGTPDDMRAFLAQEGIEIPAKAPWNLPAETSKFGRKLWSALMTTQVQTCAADEHDFQPTGNCEMERNAATMPGSSFRREQRCTKCNVVRWVSDVAPVAEAEAASETAPAADDRAAQRAARIAARKAAREAAAE